MKARKRAGTVGKVLGCALLLVIALFPIYWLVAMAIRPTSEMQGHISLIPQSLTIASWDVIKHLTCRSHPSTACRPR